MIIFLKTESNLLLYGYGSKLRLMYDFVNHLAENESGYHMMVFNCYNHEINLRYILTEIQNYIITKLEHKDEKLFSGYKTAEDHIIRLNVILQLFRSGSYNGKLLLIINNIDGPAFMNKSAQKLLSLLVYSCNIKIIATCDNLYVNYFWNQTVKDNYSFYYLKYNTLRDYDIEVSNKNSLVGEKNIKTGMGLTQILKCLTESQRQMIKKMAEIQLMGDMKQLTFDKLIDTMIEEMIVTNKDNLRQLLNEPRDHDIIQLKELNGKEMYKLNLDKEVLQKLKDGEYD